MQLPIGGGQMACRFIRPFNQFEAGAGEYVAQARIFKLLRIIEAVKVQMPDRKRRQGVTLHHRVGRTFDAAGDTQRVQEVPHQRGFARAQIAMQGDQGITAQGLQRVG